MKEKKKIEGATLEPKLLRFFIFCYYFIDQKTERKEMFISALLCILPNKPLNLWFSSSRFIQGTTLDSLVYLNGWCEFCMSGFEGFCWPQTVFCISTDTEHPRHHHPILSQRLWNCFHLHILVAMLKPHQTVKTLHLTALFTADSKCRWFA